MRSSSQRVIIWSTDSGAYFIGKSMGKRKLWPD
ncbi:phosphatidate cytidylyltransferase [Bacillus sp. SL00103]